MILFILIIIIGALWILNYLFENRDFFAPSCVFCMMLLGSLFMCVISSSDYVFELGFETLFVLVSGTMVFTICSLFHYIGRKRRLKKDDYKLYQNEIYNPIVFSKIIIVIFIVIEIAVGYFALKYIIDIAIAKTGGFSSLSSAIGIYDNLQKFDLQGLQDLRVSRHPIYSFGWPLLTSIAYILIYVICHNYILCKKKDVLYCVLVGVYFLLTFLSGGRTYAFRVITAFVCFIYYFKCVKLGFHKRQLRFIFKMLFVAFGVVAFFTFMRQALGRGISDYKWYQTMFSYYGAPIVNLDHYLRTEHFPSSNLFGQETFFGFYNYIGNRFNIKEYIYSLDLPFVFYTGRNTGNVYTMFYQFIHDFGYWGIFPLVFIVVYIYDKLYRKSYLSIEKRKVISLPLFYYGYLFNDLVMLLFSNKFYETTIAINYLRFCFWTYLIWFFFVEKRFAISGLKIIIKNKT